MAEDGGFLGFAEVQVTHYEKNNMNVVLKWESLRSVGASTGADASRQNPDPRRGKLERHEYHPRAGSLALDDHDTSSRVASVGRPAVA